MPDDADLISRQREHYSARRNRIVYKIRLSALYHLKRERFFDVMDKFTSAITAIAATAAVTTLLKESKGPELTAAVVTAMLSIVPLVVNPAMKAKHHGLLAAEFRRMLAECEHAGEEWDAKCCDNFAARTLEIEAGEPAALAALVADCQNQLAISHGDGPVARLEWYHELLKHWLDLRPDPLPASKNASP